jgi:hypothetical protein
MLAARVQGKRYFQYRNNQLGRGDSIFDIARSAGGAPTEAEPLEALCAACAALRDLGQAPSD